ncbi:hypothetical protein WJX84_012441, partial [Apatococcus fuscideae]
MASSSSAPKAVLFDVNETLISLQPLADAMEQVGLKAAQLECWFAKVLRDGISAAAAGKLVPLKQIGSYHVKLMLSETGISDEAMQNQGADEVLAGFNK